MLQTLWEDERLLVVAKPPGVLVIPGRDPSAGPSVREQLEAQRRRKVLVVHRLDRDTSGVLLFALEPLLHRALSMAFEEGRVQKRYLALTEGVIDAPFEITGALTPARRSRMRVARDGEAGKSAQTHIRPLERFAAATWVEALPLTGRTHQIRVHLAHAGHPLVVDPQYGRPDSFVCGPGGAVVLRRTPLHAASLELPPLPGLAQRIFEAPLPEDLALALGALRAPV